MRQGSFVCLAILAVAVQASPAEAGRRTRRAVRTTAIVAAATSATVVAAAPRRTTVVAAAAIAPVKEAAHAVAPDLTITDVVAESGALVVTVKNIGTAPAPETRMQIDLVRPVDEAFLAGQTTRVLPLAVNQSVRIRLRSAPVSGLRALLFVDPRQQVAELNEANNDFAISFAAPAPISDPPALDDEQAWDESSVR